MEIKPQKSAKKPFYAAALAAAASAALLTGCNIDISAANDNPQIQGISPVPIDPGDVTEIQITEPVLEGEGTIDPSYTEPVQLEGEARPEPDYTEPVQLDGDVAMPEPPVLAGSVSIQQMDMQAHERARTRGLSNADGIIEGFRREGYALTETDVWLDLPDFSLQAALSAKDDDLLVVYYDDNCAQDGCCFSDALIAALAATETYEIDQGYLARVTDSAGMHRVVFLDINRAEDFSADAAEKLAAGLPI